MYHDRTAWRYAFFAGKKYGNKKYPQRKAARCPYGQHFFADILCCIRTKVLAFYTEWRKNHLADSFLLLSIKSQSDLCAILYYAVEGEWRKVRMLSINVINYSI
jgi:hypothetical protein